MAANGETATVAQSMVQALVDAGATHVFGGHGAAIVPLVDAVMAHPKLEVRRYNPSTCP